MTNSNHLLIIDDDPAIRDLFRSVAEEADFSVDEAGNWREFEVAYAAAKPTVVILDLTMPGADGIEFLNELAHRACDAQVFLASGQDKRVLANAQRHGLNLGLQMQSTLQKPVDVAHLEHMLEQARSDPRPLSCPSRPHSEDQASEVTFGNLEAAIGNGQLVIHFQPKVDLRAGKGFPIVGSEALARWNHPTLGFIPPSAFIPFAEQHGLIEPLTEVVLQQAIAQLSAWKKIGIELPVSFNLSPKQLTDLSLPDQMASKLSAASLDPALLVVEITEQAAIADVAKSTEILTRLRLKDIAVSLDDFGAGFSSLAEMYRMPLSELKLDRSLTVDLDEDPDARTVVKALVALAHTLKIPVCAEGVETLETAQFLQAIGCEKGQGYFFSKPVPADVFTNLVHATIGDPDPVAEACIQAA